MEDLQQQLGDARDQLAGAIEFVMDDLRQKWNEISGGPSVTDGVKQFVAAVDWSERWIQGLLAFHLLLLVLVVALRRIPNFHLTVFVGIMPLVYFAERINRLAGQHWRSFAKQNYFDPAGIFTSAILSAPLLLIMFVILVHYLISTSVLLVRMKRKELLYRARQAQRRNRSEGGAGSSQAAGAPAAAGGKAAGAEVKKER